MNLKINECRHFESNQGIIKLPRQIYSKLFKVPFKHFNSKKYVIEFYIHLFKDLSSLLSLTSGSRSESRQLIWFTI